ncbi:unnamed protein product [Camellia sinensis]
MEKLKDQLLENNKQTYWFPDFVELIQGGTLSVWWICISCERACNQVCLQEAKNEQNRTNGTSKGKRGHGKSRSLKLAKLKNQGVRLPIQICKVSGRPYGEASEKFTSELGIVTRKFASQNVPLWTDISEEDKETLIAYLQ